MTRPDHRVKGVDHAAFPTFDPAGTVRFYRDVLGFPVVHSICAVGWGPEDHPDFIHFFFDIGNDDRIAFFYYFGLEPVHPRERGDVYAGFGPEVPEFFVRSRHLAIHVENQDDLLEYRRRLDDSAWPVEMRSEEHTSELQSQSNLVCRLLLETKNTTSPRKRCARRSCARARRRSARCVSGSWCCCSRTVTSSSAVFPLTRYYLPARHINTY